MSFQIVLGRCRLFQIVLGHFSSFLILVSTITMGIYSKVAVCLASVTKIEHLDAFFKDLITVLQKPVFIKQLQWFLLQVVFKILKPPMSNFKQTCFSKKLSCSITILQFHPVILLKVEYKHFSTVSINLVASYFVGYLPVATSEFVECRKKYQGCIRKVPCACKDNSCERQAKLVNFSYFL